jgi:prepilin-type processing-associated H-X9-DG protein
VVSRADYATNGGDIGTNPGTYGIWENVGNCGNGDCGPSSFLTQAQLATIKVEVEKCMPNGIDYPLSTTNTASIKDGLSFTYLLGEKYLAPDNYYNGQSAGDNEMEFMGQNWDITRQTGPSMPPQQDRPGYDNDWLFGSAHESGFNMAFCDGSVKKISYDIDPTIHLELGVRNDGQPRNLADAMGVQ